MFASKHGKGLFVSILLEAGADIHTEDEEKCTPLHSAAKSGHDDICHMLLEAGANVSGT